MEYMNHTNELYHYGVLGMKWGVRRARNRVFRSGGGKTRHSTGKNYDAVYDKMKKEKDATINKKYRPKYKKLIDDYGKSDPVKFQEATVKLNRDYYIESLNLIKKYEDQFNRATLKDINYKDVEKGMSYLKKRNIDIFDIDL